MIGDILQPTHLLIVLAVALLVLGPKRLPDVGRSLGRSIHDFRGGLAGADPRATELQEAPASVEAESSAQAAVAPVLLESTEL